jgi:Leucine Rich repeats (2 copies)/Leucine Rich repeat
MQAAIVSRPWRTFLRLSVRGLIVLVLVIGAALGWMVRSARVQRDAVAAITKTGGSVFYDWEWRNGKSTQGCDPWAPRWLVKLMGVDYFGHVTLVIFSDSSTATDATIEQVACLTQLEELVHDQLPVGDQGVIRLMGLGDLNRFVLDLSDTEVSDDGLAHLKGLTRLTHLDLSGTRVTDRGLARLKGLTKLTHLNLSRTRVTDAGLANVTGVKSLSSLSLDGCQVTDAGLVHLKAVTSLSDLWVNRTRVTGAGIKELRQARPSLMIWW